MFVYILVYFIPLPYVAAVGNFVISLVLLCIHYLCYASFSSVTSDFFFNPIYLLRLHDMRYGWRIVYSIVV